MAFVVRPLSLRSLRSPRHACALFVISAAACSRAAPGPDAPTAAASGPSLSDASTTAMASRSPGDAAIDAAPAVPALPPLPFGTRPDPHAPLSVVLEGECHRISVSLLPDATLIDHGRGRGTMSRATDHGLVDTEVLSTGLENTEVNGTVLGTYGGTMWMFSEVGNRCMAHTAESIWSNGTWAPGVGGKDEDPLGVNQYAAYKTGILVQTGAANGCGDSVTPHLLGQGVSPPKIVADGEQLVGLKGFSTGEVVALVYGGDKAPNELRFLAPGGPMLRHAVKNGTFPHFVAASPSDIYVTTLTDAKPAFVHFNGAEWSDLPLPPSTKDGIEAFRASDGDVWVLSQKHLWHLEKDHSYTPITTPADVKTVAGLDVGAPWAAFVDNTVASYDTATQTWTRVPVPKPAFAADVTFTIGAIYVRDAHDVWMTAGYKENPKEWGAGRGTYHDALLRTIAPDETLRCGENEVTHADPYSWTDHGYASWPPAADASCATPLVILASSPADKPQADYKRTRTLFKGRKELAGSTFEEIDDGPSRLFAARVPSFEVAKTMQAFYAKKVYSSRPRIVCADPPTLQTFAIDLGVPSDGGASGDGGK